MERLLSAEFDVAFLALPHTLSSSVAGPLLARGIPVIDLSADFRFRSIPLYESVYGVAHKSPALAAKAVYGLPRSTGRGSGRHALPPSRAASPPR